MNGMYNIYLAPIKPNKYSCYLKKIKMTLNKNMLL